MINSVNYDLIRSVTGLKNNNENYMLWRKYSMSVHKVFYAECSEKNIKDFKEWFERRKK